MVKIREGVGERENFDGEKKERKKKRGRPLYIYIYIFMGAVQRGKGTGGAIFERKPTNDGPTRHRNDFTSLLMVGFTRGA